MNTDPSRGHVLHEREDGLAHCKVCGGAEASLPTLCPGYRMVDHIEKAVQAGDIDYTRGGWVLTLPVHISEYLTGCGRRTDI